MNLLKCTFCQNVHIEGIMTTPYFGSLKLNFLCIQFIPEEHNYPKRELRHFKEFPLPKRYRYLQHFLGMRISTEDFYPIQLNFKLHHIMVAMIKPKYHHCTMDSLTREITSSMQRQPFHYNSSCSSFINKWMCLKNSLLTPLAYQQDLIFNNKLLIPGNQSPSSLRS